ncbi:ubiquinone biosynthesis protein [Allopseudospirillum japonicum]|uniref:Probable protein kinase UbiB n=1 Tax=Allopseudospirillum japonicum TaxID=64971 RepID=A0A1H6U2Q1_9GAMM|nr:ubiquinone biosynthesis regulatory protein kinase UbiB [Allopseudospirillum japonicum]SEI86573.1 ubiquinone biosynthesis protein [Allopseudospirillum japonicum]
MSRLHRLLKIAQVVAHQRLDTLIPIERLPAPWRPLLGRFSPMRLLPENHKSRGERLRLALEELGPIFVKFGQMLSTRRDLLPQDIADELKKLQDQVPPFPAEQAQALIEEALGQNIHQAFQEFSSQPMASASIAQVHAARLHSGEEVVVKVIRPHIDKIMRKDIALLYTFARILLKVWPDSKRLHPVEVVADYEVTLFDELDLLKEAANTSQLRRNFINSGLLYVPKVYWEYSRRNVMVQERIYGIPIAHLDLLRAQGTNMHKLAERGVEIFFTQVFRDNFFHADMHPGNIFVDCTDPNNPQYIGIDCGIVGSLSVEDQNYLARNLLAFFTQDYYEVARLHIESGWVHEDTRANEFAAAIRAVCEPIFEKPLKDISFGQVLMGLFQTARRFNMEVQPQLVLLQKTLLNIEGLGRQLYPDLDLWTTAKPYLENWMKARVGPRGVWRKVKTNFPDWLEQMPELPLLAHDTLAQLKNWEQHQIQQQQALIQVQQEIHQQNARRRARLLGLLVLGLASYLIATDTPVDLLWQHIEQQTWPVWGLILLGGWLLVRG